MTPAQLEQFQYLLAGFVAAWVFYGLTPYRRPTPFERIVQALVYTAVVQLLAAMLTHMAGLVEQMTGAKYLETIASLFLFGSAGIFILAILIGVLFAWLVNRDYPHTWLRKIGITLQTARKCNWADAFDRDGYQFVILNLKDGRRLYGWPMAWPDTHADDHFLLANYKWVSGGKLDLNAAGDGSPANAAILVASEAVDTVELLFESPVGFPTKEDPS